MRKLSVFILSLTPRARRQRRRAEAFNVIRKVLAAGFNNSVEPGAQEIALRIAGSTDGGIDGLLVGDSETLLKAASWIAWTLDQFRDPAATAVLWPFELAQKWSYEHAGIRADDLPRCVERLIHVAMLCQYPAAGSCIKKWSDELKGALSTLTVRVEVSAAWDEQITPHAICDALRLLVELQKVPRDFGAEAFARAMLDATSDTADRWRHGQPSEA